MKKVERNTMEIVVTKFDIAKDQVEFGKSCWEFICEEELQAKFWSWKADKTLQILQI